MEIRIGIRESSRELKLESSQTPAEIESLIGSAIESGGKLIKLADDKGRIYLVPATSLAYVEIGADEPRRVGFIA